MKHDAEFKPGTEYEALPTAEGYDRWAEIYDAEENPLIALEEPRVAEWLGDVRGLCIADLGCGTGRHALRLAAAGANVTAVDFSDGMLSKARGKRGWERVRFVAHDLHRTPLPLADGAFDRVISALVLDHIAELPAFFGECRRICKPDGFVLISSMHPAMMLRGILAHFKDSATGRDVLPHSVPNEISDYVMAIVRAGLHIEHMSEHAVDDALADRSVRAAKYRGWPMLLMMKLKP